MNIIAKKGEVVTCAEGHEVCVVANNIKMGEAVRSADFDNWRSGQRPARGADLGHARHCWCGAKFLDGARVHIGNRWRP